MQSVALVNIKSEQPLGGNALGEGHEQIVKARSRAGKGAILTPPQQQKPLIDATTATPDEIAAHLREALAWTQANRDLNPANAIILYAWNEHDEGGWLQPTLGADGKPDASRIRAIGKVLRSATTSKA